MIGCGIKVSELHIALSDADSSQSDISATNEKSKAKKEVHLAHQLNVKHGRLVIDSRTLHKLSKSELYKNKALLDMLNHKSAS